MGKQLNAFVSIIALLLLITPVNAYAQVDNSLFNDSFLKKANDEIYISISYEEDNTYSIQNYDLSKSGEMIICLKDNRINVYNNNGEFQYAINYYTSGKSLCFWWNDKIVIYIVRGSQCIILDNMKANTYDYTGEIGQLIQKASEPIKYYKEYTYSVEKSNSKLDDSLGYMLIRTHNPSGQQEIMYMNSEDCQNSILLDLSIIVFIVLWIIGVFIAIKKIQKLMI